MDVDFVRKSIKAIGQTAVKIDEAAERCVNVLLELIATRVSYVVQEAVVVMKVCTWPFPDQCCMSQLRVRISSANIQKPMRVSFQYYALTLMNLMNLKPKPHSSGSLENTQRRSTTLMSCSASLLMLSQKNPTL